MLPAFIYIFRISYVILCEQKDVFVSFKVNLNTVSLTANTECFF